MAYLLCWVNGLARERREAGRERSGLWPGIFWTLLGVSLAFAIHSLEDAPANWNQLAGWWGVGLVPSTTTAFLQHARHGELAPLLALAPVVFAAGCLVWALAVWALEEWA